MLSGEGNAAENGKNNNRSNSAKEQLCTCSTLFFVHFFAVHLPYIFLYISFHDYNVKLPGTS